MGKLVVLEGIDFTGKSSLVKILFEELKTLGFKVAIYKEPTTKGSFNNFYDYFFDDKVDNVTLFLSLLANRSYSVKNELNYLLDKNDFVIADRYYYSTLAYQVIGQKNEDLLKKIFDTFLEVVILPIPDYLFLLTVLSSELDTVLTRGNNKNKDNIEKRGKSYFEKINTNFNNLFFEYNFKSISALNNLNKNADIIKNIVLGDNNE